MHFKQPAGDKIDLDYATDFVPERNLSGVRVIASIARKIGETPVVQKRNTAAGGSDAELTSEVIGTILRGEIHISSNDTRELSGEYDWDLVVQTTDGAETTIGGGTFFFQPRVTHGF